MLFLFIGVNSLDYFTYSETELLWLKSRDEHLARLIDKIPLSVREVNPDPFSALVDSIISQQISGAAARSVSERLADFLGEVTPDTVLSKTDEELTSCGLGRKKASYIKGIARAAAAGEIDRNRLHCLSDAEVVKTLTALSGVGEWTAQMFLIFCLRRPDVLSYKDFGIRRGIMKLYGISEVTPAKFKELRSRYSPFCTVASFYLWEAAKLATNIITTV